MLWPDCMTITIINRAKYKTLLFDSNFKTTCSKWETLSCSNLLKHKYKQPPQWCRRNRQDLYLTNSQHLAITQASLATSNSLNKPSKLINPNQTLIILYRVPAYLLPRLNKQHHYSKQTPNSFLIKIPHSPIHIRQILLSRACLEIPNLMLASRYLERSKKTSPYKQIHKYQFHWECH